MAYVHPSLVISPKASIAPGSVRVLYDGGEWREGEPWTGWSVAELEWDGSDAVGIRWNGGGASMGNPQSRGVPTWFILPDPIAEKVGKAVLKKAGAK
jgi:hypothetical protein